MAAAGLPTAAPPSHVLAEQVPPARAAAGYEVPERAPGRGAVHHAGRQPLADMARNVALQDRARHRWALAWRHAWNVRPLCGVRPLPRPAVPDG